MKDQPEPLFEAATILLSDEWCMAVDLMIDDPFKVEFFLYNRDIIQAILDGDEDTRKQLFEHALWVASRRRWNHDRDTIAADIKMHPHFSEKEKAKILEALYHAGGSIDALQGGLPTLGKRR